MPAQTCTHQNDQGWLQLTMWPDYAECTMCGRTWSHTKGNVDPDHPAICRDPNADTDYTPENGQRGDDLHLHPTDLPTQWLYAAEPQ